MATATLPTPTSLEPGQWFRVAGITWDQYVAIAEALGERAGLRVIFVDGGLELVTTSRRHDWHAELFGYLVPALAMGLGIEWEQAGTSTYRRAPEAGVEGDKTFYFGDHARRMSGPVDIDLETQPPPDLAIEVEVTHPSTRAIAAWGRLGVPEVWTFDPEARGKVRFWSRRDDGAYENVSQSIVFPALTPDDVLGQLELAESLGSMSRWYAQLADWVRDTIAPRHDDRP